MTILVFLQNQWFKEPDKVKAIYARHPEGRNDMIARFLFMGCMTGKRLQAAFGAELCQVIKWEEVSPEIGGTSSSVFPADPDHMIMAIEKFSPDVIVCLGGVAAEGMRRVSKAYEGDARMIVLYGPHPTARHDTMPALKEIGQELQRLRCTEVAK